ncbi:MAG: aminopeptidase N [Gammaproteobacteria bacterium]|nr:aminopeptidase N [Gammaproteobacteria bacterium]
MLRDAHNTIYLKDYQPPEYLIDHVDLVFDLDETETRVRSRLQMRRNFDSVRGEKELRLDGEHLELLSLRLDGKLLSTDAYELHETGLTLFQVPDQFTLETETRILPHENTALEGLYKSGGMFCTQCEAQGFRRITWYLDRPDVMARFTTTVNASQARYPVLLSNGNPVERRELGDGRHSVTWEDPFPKPAYLFALVAGDLRWIEDLHTTPSGREVRLQIYVEPENIDKCDHAMSSLKHAMVWDEQNYGREYDLDIYMIVAVNDFNMGAMENKGLNVFNSKYVLARADTATDRDFQGIEGVIAHEYFHNWTGNRITCRDWFQLSLKEGLTVFRDQEFSADMGSRGCKRIEDVRLLRAHQFAEDAGPMAHPVRPASYIEINNFYTVTVYEKGAEVVRMQHNLLGPECFRKATNLYFDRHDGQAVTTDDFVRCMEDASDRDLTHFRNWYSQAGTPELEISSAFDSDAGVYTLSVIQRCPPTPGQPEKLLYHIPLAIGLLDSEGKNLALQLEGEAEGVIGTRVLELAETEHQFRFVGLKSRPVPSLLRGFSAPVKVKYGYSDEELMFLMAHDSDDFNRWDAGQTLAQRLILNMVDEREKGQKMTVPTGFVAAVAQILNDKECDKALLAELLTLPSESYLGDQMETVDVEGIHAAREQLKCQLAMELEELFVSVYNENSGESEYRPELADIARRSLKNLTLGYLSVLDSDVSRARSKAQFDAGSNMTDVMAALGALSNSEGREWVEALESFYQHWQSDPLVLDKWFAIQATADRSDTLQQVEQLMQHPAFSINNPNKVRALVGALCAGNPIHFHRADGAGYRFLVDRVIELNGINPQIAARLLRMMARWQRYDLGRQKLMKHELERVLAEEGLSKDVFEIASKSLERDA